MNFLKQRNILYLGSATPGDDDTSSKGIFVGFLTNGGSFPTTRIDGSALKNEDYVRPSASSTFPFTINGITFTSKNDKAFYINGVWYLDAGAIQDTSETPTKDKTIESISKTATNQSLVNKENVIAIEATGHKISINLKSGKESEFIYELKLYDKNNNVISTDELDLPLELMKVVSIEYDNTNEKLILKYKDAEGIEHSLDLPASSILKGIVTQTAEQTITNKTIEAKDNKLDPIIETTTLPTIDAKKSFYLDTTNNELKYSRDGGTTWNDIGSGGIIIVDALPTTNIKEKSIYRLNNNYYQYDATNNKWNSFFQTIETATGFDKNAKMWKGTQAEYDLITTKDNNTVYLITDAETTGGGVIIVDALPTTDIDENSIYRMNDNFYQYDNTNSKWLQFTQTINTTTGFNANAKLWKGTKAEYNAITTKDNNTIYLITDEESETITVDNITIDKNASDEIEIKEKGIEIKHIKEDNIDITATSSSNNLINSNAVFKEELKNSDSEFSYNSYSSKDTLNIKLKNNNNDVKIEKEIDFGDKILFETKNQVLTNKTIDADLNTISNIDKNNLKTQATTDAGKSFVIDSDGTWKIGEVGDKVLVDDITIQKNTDDKLEVKDGGISKDKVNTAFFLNNSLIGKTFISNLEVDNTCIVNTPTEDNQAATKKYVDDRVFVSDTGTSTDIVNYINIGGVENKIGNTISVSATGTSTNEVKYIKIDENEYKLPTPTFEVFNFSDVFTNTSSNCLDISKVNSNYKVYVLNGCMAFVNCYFSSSISQSGTGWKNCFERNTSWKYRPLLPSEGGLSRGLGSLYTSSGYQNMIFEIPSANVVRTYYTSNILNQTGGVNISWNFPITLNS